MSHALQERVIRLESGGRAQFLKPQRIQVMVLEDGVAGGGGGQSAEK
jgi:hypothetical protein